ncbi:cytochrome-c oxidase [Aneurinibacillus tyrosinisolvens]|uniref:cytochrome-c oxidase n=1 Tax=Aneurinibacillus tyrosinisolvens TaxID=1443435 RepID=UPI00063F9C0D|nr:cytochrome-c oxidase [Aneurinibacillus tyrosinisolvens]
MGVRLIKIAAVYFLIAVLFGMYMSMTQHFEFKGIHAHLALLGWASLAIAGLIYHLFPAAAQHRLGTLHFWLHNVGLPVMMIGLLGLTLGNPAFEAVIAIGAIVTIVGVLLFTVNVFKNVS